jgi:hypothetical protein
MAHKKKHKRRRRRVGAFGSGSKKDIGVKLLAIGAGFFLLGKTINSAIDKVLPKTTDPVPVPTKSSRIGAMVGEIGVGGLLLMYKKSGTIGMVTKGAGGLLAGAGLRRALGELGIMSGFQSVPVIGRHRMAGYQQTPVIGGNVPGQLAGRTPPQLSGYRPAGSGVGAYVNQGSGVMGAIGCCDDGNGSGITSYSGSGYMN